MVPRSGGREQLQVIYPSSPRTELCSETGGSLYAKGEVELAHALVTHSACSRCIWTY